MAFALFWMLRGSFQALQIPIRLFRVAEVNVTHSLKNVLLGSTPKKPAPFEVYTKTLPISRLSTISEK